VGQSFREVINVRAKAAPLAGGCGGPDPVGQLGARPGPPKDFIPLAEETVHIFAIERWILREAYRPMHSWQERYPTGTPLTMSVNLSSRHFMHPNVTGVVGHVLEETGLPPASLVLEIK